MSTAVGPLKPPVLASALTVFATCIAAGGLLLLLGRQWGMYLYVVSAVVALVTGVLGAWTFLTRAGLKPNRLDPAAAPRAAGGT